MSCLLISAHKIQHTNYQVNQSQIVLLSSIGCRLLLGLIQSEPQDGVLLMSVLLSQPNSDVNLLPLMDAVPPLEMISCELIAFC